MVSTVVVSSVSYPLITCLLRMHEKLRVKVETENEPEW